MAYVNRALAERVKRADFRCADGVGLGEPMSGLEDLGDLLERGKLAGDFGKRGVRGDLGAL